MSVLTLAQAKTHLNIEGTTQDTELQAFIDAAEALVARMCGPLTSVATTATVVSNGATLVLPVAPAVSLTSVTSVSADSAVDLETLVFDTETAIVTPIDGQASLAVGWAYTVVYQAGRATLPADLLLGVKELVRHLWRSQRGASARPGSQDSPPAPGYLIPYAVAELLAPHRVDVSVA